MKINSEEFGKCCGELIKKGVCHSDCCGVVPLPADVWERNKHLIQRPLKEVVPGSHQEVYPLPEEGVSCLFLTKECKCAIYNDRPKVCSMYGLHPDLECPYLKPNGHLRSEAKQKQVQRRINHGVDNFVKNISKKLESP